MFFYFCQIIFYIGIGLINSIKSREFKADIIENDYYLFFGVGRVYQNCDSTPIQYFEEKLINDFFIFF